MLDSMHYFTRGSRYSRDGHCGGFCIGLSLNSRMAIVATALQLLTHYVVTEYRLVKQEWRQQEEFIEENDE